MSVYIMSSPVRVVLGLVLSGLWVLPGLPDSAGPADAFAPQSVSRDPGMLFAEVTHEDGVYLVTSSAEFTAPPASVYAVLTDYERLTRLSDIVVESRLLDEATEDGLPRLHTTLKGCVFFFCRNVTRVESVTVVPDVEILSRVEPEHSDLHEGFTEWRFFALEGGGTRVDLEMRVVPDFWIPPMVGPRALRGRLLEDGAKAVERIEQFAREHHESSLHGR